MDKQDTNFSPSPLPQLYVHDIGAEDWRIAMTSDRVALIALELAAVAIHPYPVGLLSYFRQTLQHGPARLSLSETELEIVLALPMFLRLYLLGRAMMLHSRLFTDTASRSIGALNKVGAPQGPRWESGFGFGRDCDENVTLLN